MMHLGFLVLGSAHSATSEGTPDTISLGNNFLQKSPSVPPKPDALVSSQEEPPMDLPESQECYRDIIKEVIAREAKWQEARAQKQAGNKTPTGGDWKFFIQPDCTGRPVFVKKDTSITHNLMLAVQAQYEDDIENSPVVRIRNVIPLLGVNDYGLSETVLFLDALQKLEFHDNMVSEIEEQMKALHHALGGKDDEDVGHLDINVSNIMMTADGQPKFIDFGLRARTIYNSSAQTYSRWFTHNAGTTLREKDRIAMGRFMLLHKYTQDLHQANAALLHLLPPLGTPEYQVCVQNGEVSQLVIELITVGRVPQVDGAALHMFFALYTGHKMCTAVLAHEATAQGKQCAALPRFEWESAQCKAGRQNAVERGYLRSATEALGWLQDHFLHQGVATRDPDMQRIFELAMGGEGDDPQVLALFKSQDLGPADPLQPLHAQAAALQMMKQNMEKEKAALEDLMAQEKQPEAYELLDGSTIPVPGVPLPQDMAEFQRAEIQKFQQARLDKIDQEIQQAAQTVAEFTRVLQAKEAERVLATKFQAAMGEMQEYLGHYRSSVRLQKRLEENYEGEQKHIEKWTEYIAEAVPEEAEVLSAQLQLSRAKHAEAEKKKAIAAQKGWENKYNAVQKRLQSFLPKPPKKMKREKTVANKNETQIGG